MKFNKYLICALFLVLICCIGAASAAEADDVVAADDAIDEEVTEAVDVSDEVVDDSLGVSEEPALSDGENNGSDLNEVVIYVGTNDNDGDGSPENPFSTLMLARNKIAETNTKNAIINIYDGTYQVPRNYESQNKPFTFATDNLIINGIGKNVILIPDKNDNDRSFVLTTTSANFTMNNIIFNSAAGTTKAINGDNKFFKPVSGNVNAKITNCTFLGNQYTQLPRCIDFNTSYIGCIFKDFTSDYLIYSVISESSNFIYFENCVFSNLNITCISSGVDKNKVNVTFNGIWIGQNSLPTYTVQSGNNVASGTFDIFTYGKQNDMDIIYSLPVKYAIFSVSENYLGNDQYEIVGRLTWNGTDSSEGMENFPPLTVILTSTTGEIQPTATLVNGTFKVNYTSSSFEHKVTAKLDSEEKNLTFANMDLGLNAPTISLGESQNITVTFPQVVSGTVTLTVNGNNYPWDVIDSNSTIVPITDILTIGTHEVNVTFIDEINHIYGFNTTTITISKVKDYTFDISEITDVKVGDTKEITITLPNNAIGQIVISIGNNTFTEPVNGNTTKVNITGFVLGENIINITYSDNGQYETNTKTIKVSAVKETTLATTSVTTTYNVAKNLIITLTANGEVLANKTINIVVGGINENLTTNASGQVSVDVSTLVPNTYVANIAFAGDDLYLKSSTTANVVVNKVTSSLTAPKVTATYNVAKNLVITLSANGKPLEGQKVTVKVGTISKTLTTNAKGQVSVDVSKLTPKKYTATITYAGDTINAKSTITAKVVVNKAKPKLTAKKATFKAKTKTKKYSIVLKDNKGKAIKKAKLTLKVKGKTYKATTNAKGKATFKITKLTKKGKNTATIKFGGNNYFKSISKKINIVVKK